MNYPIQRSTGVRELAPGVFELKVSGGKDPLTGRYREISRRFRGTLRQAKTARARLLVEVSEGDHTGARATVDQLVGEWLKELERKGRSPRTIGEYERRYRHDIKSAIGHLQVAKVTTKMLTDLYGAHQKRGAAPGSVRKIHATISSMMTQACKWGWRESNPATWADPPPVETEIPVVPTPDQVMALIHAASESRRPEHASVLHLAATTGARRGEICALRWSHFDEASASLEIKRGIVKYQGRKVDRPTKNRRRRTIALDPRSVQLIASRAAAAKRNAEFAAVVLAADPYVFALDLECADPWDPDTITQFFGRLRTRVGLEHIEFKGLRRFTDTYGQELGFSLAQVSVRTGHDPAVAAKHYTGRVPEADRRLAKAIGTLIDQGLAPASPD